MLPPHIIEELRRREEWKRERERPQPCVELELPLPPRRGSPDPTPAEDRGVTIIDLW